MEWTRQQESAFKQIQKWLKDESGSQIFRLFGFAGTGKTTMAKHLTQGMKNPFFCAFTGKAAHILKKKGCVNSSTIHSLIYTPSGESGAAEVKEAQEKLDTLIKNLNRLKLIDDKPETREKFLSEHIEVLNLRARIKSLQGNGKVRFLLNPESPARSADVIVVDEMSMVGEDMGQDLLSFGKKVLVLGDPFQLPPVYGAGFFMKAKPDFLLDQVIRQTAESPVLYLATKVRQGEGISLGDYGESKVIKAANMNKEMALDSDQILIGTHKKRRSINRRMRDLLGHGQHKLPQGGEKVVCLRNNKELGLMNGAMYLVENCTAEGPDEETCYLTIHPEEGGNTFIAESFLHHFQNREGELSPWLRGAQEFDYGYSVTVHKYQGSQAKDILLFDQSSVFRQHSNRWLYTGITRAEEKIIVIRD